MKSYTVLMDQKIYVKMTILPKEIYRFFGTPIKIPMAFCHRTGTNNSKICTEARKTQILKRILRKRTKLKVSHSLVLNYTTKLQYSKQYGVGTKTGAGTKTDMQIKGTEQPRKKPTLLWSVNLQQRKQKYTMGKRQSSMNGVGKTGQLHAKVGNWTTFSHHIQNKLKMD